MSSTRNQLLLTFLVTLLVPIRNHECIKPLPKQLHCASTLFFKSSDSINIYNVDEYLDIKAERSSVLVEDTAHGEMQIYYNQLDKSGPRQFIKYEPAKWTCKSDTVGFWQFSNLRQLAIYLSDMEHLQNQFVEVPVGPSVLLFALNNNVAKFRYVGPTYSKARLSQMHVYSRGTVLYSPINGRMWVNVMVHIPKRLKPRLKPQKGDPLSDYLEDVPGGVAKVALLGACIMNAENDDYIPELELKKDGELDPSKLDEDNFCPRDKLLFSIRYNIVSEHHPGTLLGKSLAQIGRSHEYHREPFVRPIGIGCWGSGNLGDGDGGQRQQLRRLTLGQPQLSALYIKKRGFRGVSFVAYDRSFNLLRLDREGRKNIFDLIGRKSYHVGEFGPASRGAGVDPEVESCVVLEMDQARQGDEMQEQWRPKNHDPLSASSGDASILEQIIGLSHDESREHYLGMRVIDHVPYEVFEGEIRQLESGEFEVPIILRPDRPVSFDQSFRVFITFYARLEPDGTASLKYIELWAFDTVKKRKIFVNRVNFIEFSWSLEVEPVNDIESQTDNMGLFSLGPCYQNRASQAELVIDYRRDRTQLEATLNQLFMDQQLTLLRANEQLIYNQLAHLLTNSMEILRSNLVDLRLQFAPNGDLISRNRLADLRDGMLEMKQLGLVDMRHLPKWRKYLRQANSGAHWLRDCQLDSIARREKNWFAHCAGAAVCLIFNPKDDFKKDFLEVSAVNVLDEPNTCVVFSLKYTTIDNIKASLSATIRADLNAWRLARMALKISLPYWHERELRQFEYEAMPTVRKLDLLDSLGAKLKNDAAFLNGLKHTTADEDSAGINANMRVALTSLKLDAFRHCQLACQLDEHCASFSFCRSVKSGSTDTTAAKNIGDCVLSSLRLTGKRVDELLEGREGISKRDRFELKVTNECESQSFVLMRDDSCSLHPRDFLVDYQPKPTTLVNSASDNQSPEANEEDETRPRQVSLEDCAGQNFERCFYESPRANNFTYCPMESLCLLQSDRGPLPTSGDQLKCFVYGKRLSALYLTNRLTEMRLNKKPGGDAARSGKTTAPSMVSPDGVGLESSSKFVRELLGVDEDSCARECNLHKSNCLAFDSCHYGQHEVCRLYSIRSPVAEDGAYSPPTKLEEQARGSFTVRLVGSNVCTHHPLKPAYFQVRLRQILDKEQAAAKPATANEKRLADFEELVSSSDRAKSKLELDMIEQEAKRLTEKRDEEERLARRNRSPPINFVLLLMGLAVGCTCAIFKDQLVYVASQARQRAARPEPFGFVRQHNEDDPSESTREEDPQNGQLDSC